MFSGKLNGERDIIEWGAKAMEEAMNDNDQIDLAIVNEWLENLEAN